MLSGVCTVHRTVFFAWCRIVLVSPAPAACLEPDPNRLSSVQGGVLHCGHPFDERVHEFGPYVTEPVIVAEEPQADVWGVMRYKGSIQGDQVSFDLDVEVIPSSDKKDVSVAQLGRRFAEVERLDVGKIGADFSRSCTRS